MKLTRLFWLSTLACVPVILYMKKRQSESVASSSPELARYAIPPPPTVVPMPTGWNYLPQKLATPAVVTFAQKVLRENGNHYGYFEQTTIGANLIGAIVEPHYDNHVSANLKWHPGVSILQKVTA